MNPSGWPKPLNSNWQRARFDLDASAPCVQAMVDASEKWCRNFALRGKVGRTLILSGPFGCGKSRAMKSCARYVRDVRMHLFPKRWAHPPQLLVVDWAEFIVEVTDNKNRELMEDLLESDVVFLDDIGSEEDRFKSGSGARVLGDVLGKLHDAGKFVFITTNIEPASWPDRWDGRVHDRLLRMNSTVMDLWGEQAVSYAVWRASAPSPLPQP